ncbi:MAG: DNA repair protein RecN, partial [bacterium]|nr:DNA repair protein RecN [bacterium]
MLERLVIHNLAVIDELDIDLKIGLTVLTGETGAGKSIIVDAFNLLLGGRASSDIIRTDCEKAFVQGVFSCISDKLVDLLAAQGIEYDGELIITREVTSTRSSARINGRVVHQSYLREVGQFLADMHGQHEHQSLLRADEQLRMLDTYIGNSATVLLAELSEISTAFAKVQKQKALYGGDEGEQERMSEVLTFQIDEIDNAVLFIGEEEDLKNERNLLVNFAKLQSVLDQTYKNIYAGGLNNKPAIDIIGKSIVDLKDVVRLTSTLIKPLESLEQIGFQLDDVARDLSKVIDNLNYEPGRLEHIERRLDTLTKLKRKYGKSIEQVLLFRQEASQSLERIRGAKDLLAALKLEEERIRHRYATVAGSLRKVRYEFAPILASKIEGGLRELNMPGARFDIAIRHQIGVNIDSSGSETVEYLFSANPGEELRALAKIASGGEMSRVMLAIKSTFSRVDEVPTIVFDEIDSGIGGKAAQAVAEKIARVASGRQVVCVTHLAAVASKADHHLYIQKIIAGERTKTIAEWLVDENRVAEIA